MQLSQPEIDNLKTSIKEMMEFRDKLFENNDQVKYVHEIMSLMDLVGRAEYIVEIAEAEKLTK
jgi:hypothetical protein